MTTPTDTIKGHMCAPCYHVHAGDDSDETATDNYSAGWDDTATDYPNSHLILTIDTDQEPEFRDYTNCLVCDSSLPSDFTPAQFDIYH